MEKTTQELAPLYPKNEIDKHITDQLDKTDIERLTYGKFTGFIKDYELPDGTLKDGKLRVQRVNGELKAEFIEKKPELIVEDIPVLGKLLNKEEVKQLEAGETVKLNKYKGVDLYLKVDPELNRVTVSTSKQIGLINEIGGYKLNDHDKALWLKNEKLPPRIYYNKENDSYFQASIRLKDDGKGIEYNDYKAIKDKDVAKELIGKYNTEKMLSNTADITKEALKGNSYSRDSEVSKQPTSDKDLKNEKSKIDLSDSAFEKHVQNQDHKKLREMSNNGYKPEADKIQQTFEKVGLSPKEQRDALVAIQIDPNKYESKRIKPNDLMKDQITKKLVNVEKVDEKGVVHVKDKAGKVYQIGKENLSKATRQDKIETQSKSVGLPKKSHTQGISK